MSKKAVILNFHLPPKTSCIYAMDAFMLAISRNGTSSVQLHITTIDDTRHSIRILTDTPESTLKNMLDDLSGMHPYVTITIEEASEQWSANLYQKPSLQDS